MKLSEFVFHIICEMQDAKFMFPVKIEEEKKRLNLCTECPHFGTEQKVCGLCECYIPVKVKQLYEKCPIEKWGRDLDSWDESYCELFAKKVVEQYPEAEEWKNQLN